jgi:hypothetical protein
MRGEGGPLSYQLTQRAAPTIDGTVERWAL